MEFRQMLSQPSRESKAKELPTFTGKANKKFSISGIFIQIIESDGRYRMGFTVGREGSVGFRLDVRVQSASDYLTTSNSKDSSFPRKIFER
jgi:hypothetical protein